MPYITRERREHVEPECLGVVESVGELTFQLQSLIKDYIDRRGISFAIVADITGALHQCQRDFDERIVQPYEAKKRAENGDVWADIVRAHGLVTP